MPTFPIRRRRSLILGLLFAALSATVARGAVALADPATQPSAPAPPAKGEKARDFSLATVSGEAVTLSKLLDKGPVVLIVLRGWPGYQCPICAKQVGELVLNAGKIESTGAHVVLVYPGPSDQLKEHAEDFESGKGIPKSFDFVIDPAYTFTNLYALRWDAPRETSYPSTFVIDKNGVIQFETISKTHGGRSTVDEILKALASL